MELLWTARTLEDFVGLREDLDALALVETGREAWDRAVDVWQWLVAAGRHRHVRLPDLLIAATAEQAGIGLCHYDRDFELIAEVTGQDLRAIAPVGTLGQV